MKHSAARVDAAALMRIFVALGLTLLATACGGSDVPTGPDGGGGGSNNDPPAPSSPSFSSDVNPIFAAKGCTAGNCHGRGQGGLTLTTSASSNYASLVNVQSSDPQFLLVAPGDAHNSYLVMKVEGRAGNQMPLGGSPLSSNQIQTIRNWIAFGAPNN